MNETEIESIAQASLPLMNPTTSEMLLRAGSRARLSPGKLVYDIGCGNGTLLALWHEAYGISGVGIEERKSSVLRARREVSDAGGQIQIIEGDAAVWTPDRAADCTVALGSAFIFGGTDGAIPHLAEMTAPGGVVVIGDRYWRSDRVSPEFAVQWPEIPTEYGLVSTARDSGLTLAGLVRATEADHDAYESAIWQNCLDWIHTHPDHRDRPLIEEYLSRIQDEYLVYGREAFGWACWIFRKQN
ncbi:hypothetical protein RJ53_06230 [Methanocalculus chunghsingensis]|uniref:Methyltransferase domain-containing protein n=1 Tax=Methanocalculus chunghsingensis TaxID=156457 RepID=A0A8J7W7U1_9EURY|nr:methyltransferase domain-containing protein [Methanocalculus chunghsingensis]MBR1369113.1 hypothetical protein [Methanocalculus chunghsingensis]